MLQRDHGTGSNRPKTARTSGLVQQTVRSGRKKKEVASTECSHIAGKGADVEKVTPVIVDKTAVQKTQVDSPIQQLSMLGRLPFLEGA